MVVTAANQWRHERLLRFYQQLAGASCAGRPLYAFIGIHSNVKLLAHGMQNEQVIEIWPAPIFFGERQHLYVIDKRTSFLADKEYDYVICWHTPLCPGQSYDVARAAAAFVLLATSRVSARQERGLFCTRGEVWICPLSDPKEGLQVITGSLSDTRLIDMTACQLRVATWLQVALFSGD